MATCPSCAGEVPQGNRFCGSCGRLFETPTSAPTETSLKGEPVVASYPSLDDARFIPGTVLAERYRIVGLLGRGGMGEVYRADDLKLGQPVALKFLPRVMQHGQARLQRFLNEAKVALRVTHPNVCRVYDIGDVDGQHYLSMEYVDGEDMDSLLRRIGHLPQDKAVQAARQLCAGLAAAHDQGILHRDLKPANVMIDGRGQVKITDFGLAGLAGEFDGEEVRAGTPSYMSPEQLAGSAVTVRSDIYSLGLVLYELFTGKRAFEGRTPAEIARGRHTAPTSPSSIVTGIDPAVERITLRCLEQQPEERPGSALAVAVALPGGDPLAAALAAGETPSPELIAEAGQSGGLKPLWALPLLVTALITIGLLVALSPKMVLARRVALDKSPEVLADRAREVIAEAGWTVPPADSLYGFLPNLDYYQHIVESEPAPDRWSVVEQVQPAMVHFAYRQSPQLLVRESAGSIGNWFGDPAPTLPGMVEVRLDAVGRLIGFLAVPPRKVLPGALAKEPDWGPLLEAAGLNRDNLRPVESQLTPPSYADRRVAWEGVYPDATDIPIRLEAASYGELAVAFWIVEPWTRFEEVDPQTRELHQHGVNLSAPIIFLLVLCVAAILALRNMRSGRGDHKTALRFALYFGAVRLLWSLGAHHLPSGAEETLLRSHLAWSLFRVGYVYIFYLALEPYARRLWPRMLVSWVRLMGGRFRDPLVGRDLLLGVLFGAGCALVSQVFGWVPQILGMDDLGLSMSPWSWESLAGLRHTIAAIAAIQTTAVLETFIVIITLLVLRLLFRKSWIAIVLATPLFLLIVLPQHGNLLLYILLFFVVMAIYWTMLFRFGLLTILVGVIVRELLATLPLTFDLTTWQAHITLLTLAFVLALAGWGFWISLAGRPLFRDEILETEGAR